MIRTSFEDQREAKCAELRAAAVDVETAILGLRPLYLQFLEEVEDINAGHCGVFGKDLCSILPGATRHWNYELDQCAPGGDHCFVRWQNRWYDAEAPEGVDDWRDLPFFQRGRASLEENRQAMIANGFL